MSQDISIFQFQDIEVIIAKSGFDKCEKKFYY